VPNWSKIEQDICSSIDKSFQLKKHSVVLGGDINQAFQVSGKIDNENMDISFFIKFNQKELLDMFTAEAAGLQEIERVQAIHVPKVICTGTDENQSYLILENLLFTGGSSHSAEKLGQQLAAMHKQTAQQFGWSQNNTIGSTKQINTQAESWIDFWREFRLGYQVNLADKKGAAQSLIIKTKKLLNNMDAFFASYSPVPSLLHGDLWSGNYAYLKNGEPVIFDPAVYYGDREADIAMTELFGGFPSEFYTAYNATWPLDKGYQQRKTLYNLYHILNHYNLFGGGYAMQAENMTEQLLASL